MFAIGHEVGDMAIRPLFFFTRLLPMFLH